LQGIGLAIAAELAQQGATVAIGSRRGDDVEYSADARRAIGKQSLIAALDVSSTESVEAFVDKVKGSLGRPDILINCAGISTHQTVCGHSDEDWDRVIDINLSGPFRMIRACLPAMIEGGWGRIVNIASTAARTAKETHAAYCASKSGLVGMSRAVALEGGPYGVTCNAISPGWVETEMLRKSALIMANKSGRSQAEEMAVMAAANPQNRLIQPEEIAALAAFCCSDGVPGLTMEDIQINAGAFW
jgi:NAD(P)-dependent dehydrogenase (short-subunit alcohol dehydrogenase family)